MKTVEELRKAGYKVKVRHNRVPKSGIKLDAGEALSPCGFAPKGGSTEVNIYDQQNELVTGYTAFCCPKDQYNRKIGKNIALGRALKQVEIINGKLFKIFY